MGWVCVCVCAGKRWGGAGVRFFAKPSSACHCTHSNPVINRNGTDEVETKMRSEGCWSRAGLIFNKIV